jgi:hypothetical protein
MSDDRRVRRSERLDLALSYQLEACVERLGLEEMLLADQDGLLVASSAGEASSSEEIAAILPLLARGHDFTGNLLGKGVTCHTVAVSGFRAANTDLFLCALGDNGPVTFDQIALAKEGVARILN